MYFDLSAFCNHFQPSSGNKYPLNNILISAQNHFKAISRKSRYLEANCREMSDDKICIQLLILTKPYTEMFRS